MKQKLKALASLCLALALTLCLTLPAWAAGDGGLTKGSTGTVTITELPETSTDNLKVTAYKIIEVNYYSDTEYDAPYDPAFDWVSENDTADDDSKSVADWVRENYQAYIGLAEQGKEPDNSVQDVFKKDESADFAAFYDDLANAIRKNDVTFDSGYTVESETTSGAEGGPSITLTPVAATDTSLATVTCNLNKFEMGSYLVLIEGGMKIYKPVVVNLTPKWDKDKEEWTLPQDVPDLTVKYSEPGITKTVTDTADGAKEERKYAQVDIGDTVTYTLVADVPQFPADAINKGYQISDILPDGMTLNADSITVWGYTGDGDTAGDVIAEKVNSTGAYTLTVTDNAGSTATRPVDSNEDQRLDPVTFKLDFDYDELHDSNSARYTELIVTYTATANKDIKVVGDSEGEDTNTTGNQNTAYLDYNNNPYEKADDTTPLSWQTAKATATVYTYGIKVQKQGETQEGDQVENLSGAVFELTAADDYGNFDSDAAPIKFVPVTPNTVDGAYRKAVTDNENSATTELEVGNTQNSGQLQLSGLDVGTYYLKETKAPDGYNLLAQPVKITITDDGVGVDPIDVNGKPEYTNSEDGNEVEADDGYVPVTVINTQGFTLPTTGGMGTVLFTAGGVVLMGAGLVLLVVFLRRRRAK